MSQSQSQPPSRPPSSSQPQPQLQHQHIDEKNSVWCMLKEVGNAKGVTEIVINDVDRVFVERSGQFIHLNSPLQLKDIYDFVHQVAQINNKKCDLAQPVLDGLLPDGSRINILLTPVAFKCPAITIRKYLKHIHKFDPASGLFGLNTAHILFLQSLVHAKVNIVISGGTNVGKTTFLNLLLQELNPNERVITIEDTRELNFNLPNSVRIEVGNGHLSVRQCVKNTLRMRPDRIIMGEVRGEEVFDLLQAMNTGHEGSMNSIHANSSVECLRRLETLYQLSGHQVPLLAIREQIYNAIDFIIQLTRLRSGVRMVTEILEVTGVEGDKILTQKIAALDGPDRLKFTGLVPDCMGRLEMAGLSQGFFDQV